MEARILMAGRRTSARPSVSVASLADTGHDGTDRVMIQAEQNLQDLQDRVRSLRSQVLAVAGRSLGRQILTGSGTYTPNSGATRVHVRMIGGGGGGGGATPGAGAGAAAGGSSGALLDIWIGEAGVPIQGGAYSCGAGGAGGTTAPGAGGSGGDTTIVINRATYVAKGGGGGAAMTGVAANGNANPTIPAAGTSSGGLVTHGAGGIGQVSDGNMWFSGGGGGTALGPGGAPAGGTNAGVAGGIYGGGGGGAAAQTGARAGGAGAAGVIVLEEYS